MNLYKFLWDLGKASGCHQQPDRSFSIHKMQFPVCARCAGVWFGYTAGLFIYIFYQLDIWIALLLCLIMFIDWFLQYKHICMSTNIRRLFTGILCGFGYIHIILYILMIFIRVICDVVQ